MNFDDDFPCNWFEEAGMLAGATFISSIAAAAGWYGQGLADLLSSLFL